MRRCASAALVIGLATAMPGSAYALDDMERAALHVAMVQHIDRMAVGGLWLRVDMGSGAIKRLSPSKSHAQILTLGETYVLCTDFVDVDANGAPVNVDFYVIRQGDRFVTVQSEVANRGPLQALVAAGRAAPLD